jgi:hypothetical protein
MSSIAVFLVIGGGAAFAAAKNSIGTRELKPNSVNRAILARNSVYPGKINLEAVKAGRIAKNAIARDRLRNGIVTTDKIADLAVTGGKLANLAVTNPKIANDAVTGAKVDESTLGQVPSAANADSVGGKSVNDIAMWAFVSSNGNLFRSSGGVASTQIGTGTYNVSFPRDINTCAYNATNAANDNTNPAPNEIAVAKLAGANNVVRVRTAASNGTITNDQFMLVVNC